MLAKLPEKEIFILQKLLLKRPILLFIMENLLESNLTTKMIGHRVGEFSNKKVGPKIMILHEIEKERINKNISNGSFGHANFFRLGFLRNGFFIC
jgi:hypothetical protein